MRERHPLLRRYLRPLDFPRLLAFDIAAEPFVFVEALALPFGARVPDFTESFTEAFTEAPTDVFTEALTEALLVETFLTDFFLMDIDGRALAAALFFDWPLIFALRIIIPGGWTTVFFRFWPPTARFARATSPSRSTK